MSIELFIGFIIGIVFHKLMQMLDKWMFSSLYELAERRERK